MAFPSSLIGQTISHYRVLEELGHGGMGVVYLAEDTQLGRKVALKALPPEAARDPDRRRRFQQEARAAAALSHPGVATVYELVECGDELLIAYEYIAGQNLRTLLHGNRLPLDDFLGVASDMAEALAAAHSCGIVHRDLKPENVMRTPDGQTKILDFGLVRLPSPALDGATRSAGLTQAGAVVGTVAYMSPEQLEGKPVDFRSDLFTFGVLLYELATAKHPFEGSSAASTIANIMTVEPVALTERNPLSPPELERIVRKCLRKRREERYQSTRDLAVDLRTLKRESGEQPSSTVAPAPVASEDRRLSRIRLSWNIAQIFTLLVTGPLWIYLAWWGSTEAGVSWAKPAFIAVCVGVGINLAARGTFLSFALLGIPDFPSFLRRNFYWQRLGLWLAAPPLAALAFPLAGARLGLAATLAAIALITLAGGEVAEPAFTRAAFPQAFAEVVEPAKPKRDPRLVQIAVTRTVFAVILPVFCFVISEGLNRNIATAVQRGEELPVFFVLMLALLICVFILVRNGEIVMRFLIGDLRLVPRLANSFSLFLLNLLGGPILVAIRAGISRLYPARTGGGDALVQVFVLVTLIVHPVFIWLIFREWKTAHELLRESGELEGEPAKPKRDRRFVQIAAAQGVMLWMYFVMLLFAAGFGHDIVNTELLSGAPGRAVPYMLAVPILTAALVSSAALVARSLQQSRQALRVFLRLFPLYWLLGQAYAVPAFWMTNRPDHPQFGGPLLVAAVLVIPLAILPFYQRRLARELLHESGEFTEDARTSTPPVKRPLVWWWAEVIFVSIAYLFMPFFAWWVRNNATDWWQTGPNNVVFVALLVCVMVPLVLRVITMETAFFTPQDLAERVRRFARAIRFFTYSHAALVAVMGLELTLGRYPLLVPVLWMMAAGIVAWGLVFEPIVERAAFPAAFDRPPAQNQ